MCTVHYCSFLILKPLLNKIGRSLALVLFCAQMVATCSLTVSFYSAMLRILPSWAVVPPSKHEGADKTDAADINEDEGSVCSGCSDCSAGEDWEGDWFMTRWGFMTMSR